MKKIILMSLLALSTLSAEFNLFVDKEIVSGKSKVSNKKALPIKLTGTVVSDNEKMLTSRYMGFIKQMLVSEGDIVKKGQLLYEIDSKEIESAERQVYLAISQARLALQMNKNQYTNVLLNLGRQERLFKKKMVSKYEFETIQLAAKNLKQMVKISEEQVNQALAKKDEVLNQYNYLKIKAPNDGVIVSKRLNEGEMAIPGVPAVILTDLSRLTIMSEVSEGQLRFVPLGKKVKIVIPSIGFKTIGTVKAIIPSSNPMTHKFKIKVGFENNSKSIYPGMYVKLTMDR